MLKRLLSLCSGHGFFLFIFIYDLQLFNFWIDYFNEAVKTENVSGNTFSVSIGRISFDMIMHSFFSAINADVVKKRASLKHGFTAL